MSPIDAMRSREMRLITCVLYRGGGRAVIEALHKRGINSAGMYTARGSAIGDPVGRNGTPPSFEKEIVVVTTPAAEADELFDFIYETAGIDRPHGGMLYMSRLGAAVAYVLPDLPAESAA